MSKALQRALAAAENTDSISLPGVTFMVYMAYDPATGENLIQCVVKNEIDYFQLELQAQQRGKSVRDHLYAEMLPMLEAHGFNTPPDCRTVAPAAPRRGAAAPSARTRRRIRRRARARACDHPGWSVGRYDEECSEFIDSPGELTLQEAIDC